MVRHQAYLSVPGGADPNDSDELESREQGQGGLKAEESPAEDISDLEVDEGRGMLTGVSRRDSLRQKMAGVEGKSRDCLSQFRCSLRTCLLTILAAVVVVLLMLLFHPSSPYAASIQEYYHSATLTPGTYSPDAVLADNPLPPDGKFGDIPFASVGAPLVDYVPEWAGGDGGASKAEHEEDLVSTEGRRWNGTHWWDKTVILISLDGVRADYLEKGVTPHLLSFSKRGLRAEYLKPVFPSLTFPNHYSLITGLYPASHGIVANDFFDPETGKEFVYTDPTKSWPPEWWGGEPIWSTAVKNGLKSAVLMWPGPPKMKDGTSPSYWYAFENKFHYSRKIEKISQWLDLPRSSRPQLITAYAPEVDQEGHRTGPGSDGVEHELIEMDHFAKGVYELLEQRNLTDVVDVIFVSDHGMTSTHNERLVFLDDILGKDGFEGIEHNEGWPSAGLRFQPHIDTDLMMTRLQNASQQAKGGFHVYTHDTMPERWHFGGHERIAPIYVVPHVGWAISDRHDFHVKMNGDYKPKGNHGYDNEDPTMHAIFSCHGPFANTVKDARAKKRALSSSSRATTNEEDLTTVIPGFANLEIYNLVAELLGIDEANRAPTNGTEGFWKQYL